MRSLDKEIFACIDCEMTGLDPVNDRVIEVAVALFKGEEILESFETLIEPGMLIPDASMKIHHITDLMVRGKPKIEEIIPKLVSIVGNYTVVGHGISNDIGILKMGAERAGIPFPIGKRTIDTFRLARLYGESPTNSLDQLRHHFNIEAEGAHRAMGDVIVNISVFRYLAKRFKSVEDLYDALSKPILLKAMPLGKHKGRPFSELPLNYLRWAGYQEFDEDLLFSIRTELKKRKSDNPSFYQSSNPFHGL